MLEMQKEAYKQAIDDFMTALQYDINTVVEIATKNGQMIFSDKKTQKYISDQIMQTVKKNLDGKTFRF